MRFSFQEYNFRKQASCTALFKVDAVTTLIHKVRVPHDDVHVATGYLIYQNIAVRKTALQLIMLWCPWELTQEEFS
jgi:hypothetical protein